MASLPPKINECAPIFSPTTPHFFKIILEHTSKHSKLRVPNQFVKKYWEDISSPVCLTLPSGSEWKIEIGKWDDDFWFDKGWPQFCKFYSIDCGSWLVFGYEGDSKFRVNIFDTSCTEIDYPFSMHHHMEDELCDFGDYSSNSLSDNSDSCDHSGSFDDPMNDDDDDSIEILGSISPCPKKSWRRPKLPCPLRPHKKSKKHDVPTKIRARETVGYKKENASSLERAKEFKSQTASSFIVAMSHTYIKRGTLWLPIEFDKLHHSKKSCEVTLQVMNGKDWAVSLRYEEGRSTFGSGWLDVVRGNNLRVGDVCVFVLLDNIKPVFDVYIFRNGRSSKFDIDWEETTLVSENQMEETDNHSDEEYCAESIPQKMQAQAYKKRRTSSSAGGGHLVFF